MAQELNCQSYLILINLNIDSHVASGSHDGPDSVDEGRAKRLANSSKSPHLMDDKGGTHGQGCQTLAPRLEPPTPAL